MNPSTRPLGGGADASTRLAALAGPEFDSKPSMPAMGGDCLEPSEPATHYPGGAPRPSCQRALPGPHLEACGNPVLPCPEMGSSLTSVRPAKWKLFTSFTSELFARYFSALGYTLAEVASAAEALRAVEIVDLTDLVVAMSLLLDKRGVTASEAALEASVMPVSSGGMPKYIGARADRLYASAWRITGTQIVSVSGALMQSPPEYAGLRSEDKEIKYWTLWMLRSSVSLSLQQFLSAPTALRIDGVEGTGVSLRVIPGTQFLTSGGSGAPNRASACMVSFTFRAVRSAIAVPRRLEPLDPEGMPICPMSAFFLRTLLGPLMSTNSVALLPTAGGFGFSAPCDMKARLHRIVEDFRASISRVAATKSLVTLAGLRPGASTALVALTSSVVAAVLMVWYADARRGRFMIPLDCAPTGPAVLRAILAFEHSRLPGAEGEFTLLPFAYPDFLTKRLTPALVDLSRFC
jgi:hypothetical protein